MITLHRNIYTHVNWGERVLEAEEAEVSQWHFNGYTLAPHGISWARVEIILQADKKPQSSHFNLRMKKETEFLPRFLKINEFVSGRLQKA